MLRMQEMTFPGFKFQKFSGGVLPEKTPPIHAWYIGHTRGLQPLLSPSNLLSHRKVPFQKMPPHGKILKKGPDIYKVVEVESWKTAGLNYVRFSAESELPVTAERERGAIGGIPLTPRRQHYRGKFLCWKIYGN